MLELHQKLNLKNHKKDGDNLLGMNSSNLVQSNSNVDKKILCTSMQKEKNTNSLHNKEGKEMTKLFHIKVHVKKTKVDALFEHGA